MAIGDTSGKQARIAFLRKTPTDFSVMGTGGTISTTTPTDMSGATLNFDVTGTKDYLIIGTCAVKTSATNRSISCRVLDNDSLLSVNSVSMYSDATGGYWPYVSVAMLPGLSGSQSFVMQGFAESLNTLTYSVPTLLAIDLSKYANVYSDEQLTASLTSSTSFQDKCTVTQTTNNNRHLVISYACYRRAVNNGATEVQTTVDGVENCKSQHNPSFTVIDNKFHFSVYSHYPTNESHTYKIQHRSVPGTASSSILNARLYVIEYNDNPATNLRGNLNVKGNARFGG